MADGGLRRSTRALREIQQDGAGHPTLETSVFGLRGEALANRVRAAAKAAGLSDKFLGHSARIGMAREMVGGGGAQRRCAAPRSVEARGHGGPLHPRGEATGEALKWLR